MYFSLLLQFFSDFLMTFVEMKVFRPVDGSLRYLLQILAIVSVNYVDLLLSFTVLLLAFLSLSEMFELCTVI
jgi:hypothetical protein